ncbi:hypothetical protein [Flavobacterium seoulense]|uniref:Uncharacterized protein n=1 Tax=Flavobacterium seoulense TaxID=1492738 RepID=A0A066X1B3_9FLAO|nr:hypothetical protein [Flavobacterium seoulense]KDN56705.1 hypothetical protein FEM21_02080 [Flavobacterium seoulense]
MTCSDVKQKIDSITYTQNRYFHSGALNICEAILSSKNFSKKVQTDIRNIYLELKTLSEPWGYWEKRNSPDSYMFNRIVDCLDSIYELM